MRKQIEGTRTISMSRAVNMAIMPFVRLVLDMRGIDGDSASLFFRRLVDLRVVRELCTSLSRQDFCYSSSESRLAMIDMPNGTNVHMGFRTRKLV